MTMVPAGSSEAPPQGLVTPIELGGSVHMPRIVATRPSEIALYGIWGHELQTLLGLSRPIALAVSAMLAGGFLGQLPYLCGVAQAIADKHLLDVTAVCMLAVAGGCLAGSLATGYFAIKGQREAQALKDHIQTRCTTPTVF
jgi:hypothetical protein